MDLHAWIALATLAGAILLFITKWIPMEATALSIPVVLAATGTIAPAGLALAGFGNHAVIAIGAIFILGAALKESGVATLMARGIARVAGQSQARAIVVIMLAVATLSSFMSSAATVAVFLPAVSVLARRMQLPSSRLMMPLAFAAIVGGTLTLIGTTPNLILGEELARRTGTGLGMFEFSKIGVPVTLVVVAYMATIGMRFLPSRADEDRLSSARLPEEVAENYGFTTNLYRMKVVDKSKLRGMTIRDAGVRARYDLDVVLIARPGKLGPSYLHAQPDVRLQAGDEIYLEGEAEDAWRFAEEEILQFGVAGPRALDRILGRGLTLAEVTLTPHSRVLGQTFKQLDFNQRWGLNVLSVWDHGRPVTTGTGDHELQLGDSFMVSGAPQKVRELARSADYVVLTDDSGTEDVRRAPLAIGLMLLAVLPPIFGWLPLAVSAIGSSLLMVGTGCISLEGARRAMNFRVLFMIIGTIPLGTALEQTGVAEHAARLILDLGATGGTPVFLFALFVLSAVIATMVNNGAAAVVLAPIAATIAADANITMNKAFLAVAFGASCAFVLPFGNQCSLMVMGPGGYRAKDYLRAGAGVTILMTIVTIGMLMWM